MNAALFRSLAGACLMGLAAGVTAADGLAAPPGESLWPQWQARITVNTLALSPLPLTSGALLGDYYFNASAQGGFRASSGVMVGNRGLQLGSGASALARSSFGPSRLNLAAAWEGGPEATSTVPYLGLGYSGTRLKGGLSFVADVGLIAEQPSGARRALLGNQGLDAAVRELRLSPWVQLGVSYSF